MAGTAPIPDQRSRPSTVGHLRCAHAIRDRHGQRGHRHRSPRRTRRHPSGRGQARAVPRPAARIRDHHQQRRRRSSQPPSARSTRPAQNRGSCSFSPSAQTKRSPPPATTPQPCRRSGCHKLTKRAITNSLGNLPATGSLLAAIMTDLPNRVAAADAATRLDAFSRLLNDHGNLPDSEIGKNLWKLGFYLADPHATPRNLADNRKWRAVIESALTDPSRSIEQQMRAKGLSPQRCGNRGRCVAPRRVRLGLVHAWGPVEKRPAPARSRGPVAAPCWCAARFRWQRWRGDRMAACGGRRRPALDLSRAGARRVRTGPMGRATPSRGCDLNRQGSHRGPRAPEEGEWRFGLIDVPDGSGAGHFAQPIPLAVAFNDGPVLAVEDGLSIEPEERNAFLCGEQPTLRCWNAAGRDIGLADLDPAPDDASAEHVQQLTGTRADRRPRRPRAGTGSRSGRSGS